MLRKRNQSQAESDKANAFNQQIKQMNAHLRDRDYTQMAAMSNLSALIAQEEGRSFGSGRVIARNQNRAISAPIAAIERDPILCWSCKNLLRDGEIDPNGRVVACKKCSNEYEAAVMEREELYAQARTERVERAEAEHEEWRQAQYECRLVERASSEARKGQRYETGQVNLDCESIQGSFGWDYLHNPILRNFFSLGDYSLVPHVGDLILEGSYKKEQISGSGWIYWLLVENAIVVVEIWEEILFPAVIEKVEVL